MNIRQAACSRVISTVVGAFLTFGGTSEAAPAGAVSGQGSRAEWTITADVRLRRDGTASGHLQIVRNGQDQADNGGVHINSGITSKAAFLLARGGTHPDTNITVTPLGDSITRDLFYWAMILMPSNADPFTMRDFVVASALARGYDEAVTAPIKQAFAAVEVGIAKNDVDGDSFPDVTDICRFKFDPGQEDQDGDSIGDACDGDDDGDGVPEKQGCVTLQCLLTTDNCPGVYNPDQLDANLNNIGAACDPAEDGDLDDDLVPDKEDNCPTDYNPRTLLVGGGQGFQPDVDGDGRGDACDPDTMATRSPTMGTTALTWRTRTRPTPTTIGLGTRATNARTIPIRALPGAISRIR